METAEEDLLQVSARFHGQIRKEWETVFFLAQHHSHGMSGHDQPTGGKKRVGILLHFRERDGTRDGTEL
jgi:hypothetical protein